MILAIDQGTTSTRSILLNKRGKIVSSHSIAIAQHFPRAGWVEHDPRDIWKSVEGSMRGALKTAGIKGDKVRAIAITNQRETVSLFEGSRPLHRFIVWQDRRTADDCKKLESHATTVLKRAGLPIDPYFSATKIAWLKRELKLSSSRSIRFRTIDSFLISKLTGEDAIEATNASRTSLLNLRSGQWDPELFSIYMIPASYAPPVYPSEDLGLCTRGLGFLPDGIPVQAVLGDQQAALFGQLGWKKGVGKITFGTGSFVLLNTGSQPVISKNNLVSTIAIQWASGRRDYALEGSAFISGAWIQWLRDQLQIIDNSGGSERLARSVQSSDGVVVVPALSGLGAPFWLPHLRGAIMGLTRGSNRGHIARASLEALAFQNRALIDAMIRDAQGLKAEWRVDGGAVANNLLMQIQADVLNSKILRPKNLEATATGVGLLALLSMEALSLKDIEKLWKQDRIFQPSKNTAQTRMLYEQWVKAVVSTPTHSLPL